MLVLKPSKGMAIEAEGCLTGLVNLSLVMVSISFESKLE